MQAIYLDHNATTPVLPEVLAAMATCPFGNPSSLHAFGQEAKRALDRARAQVAALVGAHPDEILFTSGGTEADNLALRAALPFGRLVVSTLEHSAVREPAEALETQGLAVHRLPVNREGRVDPEALPPLLAHGRALVSVMHANNEVGTLQPIQALAALARERGSLIHTDAVQSAGRIPVDVRDLGVDLLSLSAHKLGGPRGVGALFVRRGVQLPALLLGGPQEQRLRAGTENLPGIVGFGVACDVARARLETRAAHTRRLRDALANGIQEIPGTCRHGHPVLTLPNTLNIGFEGLASDELLLNLDLEGIAVASGAACASEARKPSPVLLAMGRTRAQASSALRFSFGEENTDEDVSCTLQALKAVVARLRPRKDS